MKEDILEKKIEDYAYTLPHSSTGIGPKLKHYDTPSVKEARNNGWEHRWSYEHVVKIVKHFFNEAEELGEEKMINKSYEWLKNNIEKYLVAKADGAYYKDSLLNDFRKKMEEK